MSRQIALIGNPNCGKTTVFNALTGSKQRVGNWAGVTVDKKSGEFTYEGDTVKVIDLPGTYAFEASGDDISQDELVVRHFLNEDSDSILVNIIDASNLQRHLYLTYQLLDLERPMVVVLNMMDMAKLNGLDIQIETLSKALGCPVIPVSASKNRGVSELKAFLAHKTIETPTPSVKTLNERASAIVEAFFSALPENSNLKSISRWELIEVLFGSNHLHTTLTKEDGETLVTCRQSLANLADGELDIALASARYEAIDELAKTVVKTVGVANSAVNEWLDKIALGRITGIPVFLLVMFLMFHVAINVGSSFIDFFEILAGAIFVDGFEQLLVSVNAPNWMVAILAKGIGAGIQTVASFIPVIGAMFLCLSFLEDSGYLARAAIVVDRGMRAIGLPGKAFVPMLVGFGCNIPAIMGTRTLESHRDRLMSIMMIPFMSCGARLPVYALFAAIFFPSNGGAVVYGLYLLGIVVAIFTGFMLKHSILKGPITPFIMELPAYHLPTFKGLMLHSWDRLKSFITKAGKAIILVVALLGVLNTWGTDGTFGNEDSENSVLSSVGKAITPVFEPMGITEENWPATVGVFTGIFAKESVIGTLNSLYAQMDGVSDDEDEGFNFIDSAKEAVASIGENLSELPAKFLDPLGIRDEMADGDLDTVKENNEIDDTAVSHISALFGSKAAVMAYLIFVLLYTPCVAALGAVYREAGARWTVMVAVWTFVLGWGLATAYFQASLLGSAGHQSALYWLIGIGVGFVVMMGILRLLGRLGVLSAESMPVEPRRCDSSKKGNCC